MGATLPNAGGGAGGGRRRRIRRNPPMSEINITPFVDVMLVLLIIFMVAAPLLTAGVPLQLPETAAQQLPRERTAPLSVSVDGAGRVFVEQEELTLERLPARLREEIAQRDDDKVYIRGDRDVGYGEVMRVMGVLNAAGFRNIGLVTDRERPGAGGAADGAATQDANAEAAAPGAEAQSPPVDGAAPAR